MNCKIKIKKIGKGAYFFLKEGFGYTSQEGN